MSDPVKLRAALGDWTPEGMPPWELKATVINAARERLAQMESGSIIITRDAEGICFVPLWNLGYEAREVEPQPCGAKSVWRIDAGLVCSEHLGGGLADSSKAPG